MCSPPRLTVSTTRKLAVLEAEHGEGAARRVAARHPWVDAVRQAGDLQFQIALIAPEPRQRVIGRALAEDRPRPRIWPDRWRSARIPAAAARRDRAGKLRAIADRGNVGIRGRHAVRRRRCRSRRRAPRLARQRVLGDDADAGDHDVGRQPLAVGKSRPRSARPPSPWIAATPVAELERAPKARCASSEERRHRRRNRAAQRPVGDLHHRHLAAELPARSRRSRGR